MRAERCMEGTVTLEPTTDDLPAIDEADRRERLREEQRGKRVRGELLGYPGPEIGLEDTSSSRFGGIGE